MKKAAMKHLRESLLHSTFEFGITVKAVDGLLEIIGGALLWFKSSSINELVQTAAQHELSRGEHAFIFTHLSNASQKLASGSTMFASIYLATHGLVKLILVICLWLNRLWAYPMTMAVFGGFMAYQILRYTRTHSIALLLLTFFDAILIFLTWKEFQRQKLLRAEKEKH